MVKYSVIVPVYNAQATLDALLSSLEKQNATDFEVILVDDCSTDESAQIAQRHQVVYERMPANGGPAAARNRGAELAQGSWFVFADADTEFMPETLELIDEVLNMSDADALVGSYSGMPANPGFMPRYKGLWEYAAIDMGATLDERGLAPLTTWAPRPGVIRRSAFEAVGGFNTRFRGADLEDMELGSRLAKAGYKIYFAPAARIKHNYPTSLRKELRDFGRRSAIWMRMFVNRRTMESVGEGSPGEALAALMGMMTFGFLFLGALYAPLLWAAAVTLVIFAALSRRFLRLAWKEEGVVFAVTALLVRWLHTIVMGFAAGYGLLTASQGKY